MKHFLFGTKFYSILFYELSGDNKVREREIFYIYFSKYVIVRHPKKENASLRVRQNEYINTIDNTKPY